MKQRISLTQPASTIDAVSHTFCSDTFYNNMDSFHVHFKLSNLKMLGNFFRLVEVFVFLIFVTRAISFQFQFSVGEYARRLFSILLSHRFVFVIGNVIVITLFANSGKDLDSDSHPDKHTPKLDTVSNESIQTVATQSEAQSVSAQDASYGTERNNLSIPEITERFDCARVKIKSIEEDRIANIPVLEKNKACFKRSYSECLEVENYIKPRRILRRTATEGCRGASTGGRFDEVEGFGDGMSDEEFRVMVETFIAKQQRSLREEEKRLSFVN